MLPFVYGFEWSAGHLIFIGVFMSVAVIVCLTMVMAAWRAHRDLRGNRVDLVRWHIQFHELSPQERSCRHDWTGELRGRVCENEFACGRCPVHARLTKMQASPGGEPEEFLGMPVPLDRFYHRGHTWVKPQEDGTVLVGLDEMGQRMIGRPDFLELPPNGAKLTENAPAFRIRKKGSEVTVLAPLSGEVVETGEPGDGWLLMLRPDSPGSFAHLLQGGEVHAWYLRELQRLQFAFSTDPGAPSLADGGVLVEDLSEVCPQHRWDAVCGSLFLDI